MGLKLGKGEAPQSTEGVWVNVHWDEDLASYTWWRDDEPALSKDGEADARLCVSRSGNPDAEEYARKARRKYRPMSRRGGGLPDHILEKILHEQYAHTVLRDWEGVEFPDGAVPDYEPDRGIEAFKSDSGFFQMVVDVANSAEAFRNEALSGLGEELGNGSSGRSDPDPSSGN